MISCRFNKILVVCALASFYSSCGPKKDFVITDDYVSKEMGINPTEKNKGVLSEDDKNYVAKKLGVKPSQLTNDNLYSFIKKNENRNNGSAGITARLYAEVYNKKVLGEPVDILADKRLELFKDTGSLREGDLVFFRTNSEEVVTHVGVYLKNDHFFSSQNNKAEIYNLKKGSWRKNFVSGGRFKQ